MPLPCTDIIHTLKAKTIKLVSRNHKHISVSISEGLDNKIHIQFQEKSFGLKIRREIGVINVLEKIEVENKNEKASQRSFKIWLNYQY